MRQSRAGCLFARCSLVPLLILAAHTVPDAQYVVHSVESHQHQVGVRCVSEHCLLRASLHGCHHLRGGRAVDWDVVEAEYDYLAATTENTGGEEQDNDDDESGEKESAAWVYETALDKDPTDPDALTALGRILETENKDFEGAERLYVAALQKHPTHRLALYNLSRLLSRVKADQEGAVELLGKAVQSDPQFYPAVHQYARMLQSVRGECGEAERMYRLAHSLRPGSGALLSDLGSLVAAAGSNPAFALHLFKQAVRVSPAHPDALANLAQALPPHPAPHHPDSPAQALYRRALAADPQHVPSLCNLGLLLGSAGKCGEAEAEGLLRRALRVEPAHTDTLANLGRLLHERGAAGEAGEVFEEILRLDPAKVEGLNGKGLAVEAAAAARWQSLDPDQGAGRDAEFEALVAQADALFSKALRVAPADCDTLCNRAALLHAHRGGAGRAEAEGLYRRVVEAEPEHAEALYNLAFLKQQEMEVSEAEGLYERAFELRPQRLEFRNALAQFANNKYRSLLVKQDTRDPVDAVLRAKKDWNAKLEADEQRAPEDPAGMDDPSSTPEPSSEYPDP